MKKLHFGRTQKAATLVPLAALSAVWTASLVGVGGPGTTAVASGERGGSGVLPDGTSVPTQAIEAPASVSKGFRGTGEAAVQTASVNGIPSAALSAYQRAATVINTADKGCKIPWQLIAAIGRVESDHGRYGGNRLDANGVARPGIYGIALNGSKNTSVIKDTDAGQLDRDTKFDRAVGPMQFIPSTWSVVGVDADGDGKRNPQDIDDAALATAVYLCSGDDDLSREPGQRAAVFRYNHSQDYVDLVLSIMRSYMSGDFMTVPDSTTSAGYFYPDPSYTPPAIRAKGPRPGSGGGGGGLDGGDNLAAAEPPSTQAPPSDDDGSSTPAPAPTPAAPTQDPLGPVKDTVKDTTGKVEDTVKDTVKDPVGTVQDTLTQAEATTKCLAQLGVDSVASLSPLKLLEFNSCMDNLGF